MARTISRGRRSRFVQMHEAKMIVKGSWNIGFNIRCLPWGGLVEFQIEDCRPPRIWFMLGLGLS